MALDLRHLPDLLLDPHPAEEILHARLDRLLGVFVPDIRRPGDRRTGRGNHQEEEDRRRLAAMLWEKT